MSEQPRARVAVVKPLVPEKLRAGYRRCDECQWTFRPRNRRQRFCEIACRHRNYYHRTHPAQHRRNLLDGQDYADMIALFVTGEWTFAQIAERYHVTRAYAQQIINRTSGEYHAPAYKRNCLWCGVAFEAHLSHQVYCSSGHAAQASGKRLRDLTKDQRDRSFPAQRLRLALRYARWRREDYNRFGVWTSKV